MSYLLSKQTSFKPSERVSNWARFLNALTWNTLSVIAEIKPTSPTLNAVTSAKKLYQNIQNSRTTAHAYSILIDEADFWWSPAHIEYLHPEDPALYKEFVHHEQQIIEAAHYGYDAVLLISELYTDWEQLLRHVQATKDLNMIPVVECGSIEYLDRLTEIIHPEQAIIGINARDLHSLEIRSWFHQAIYDKRSDILSKYTTIAMSGISDLQQLTKYEGIYDAVLIWSLFHNTWPWTT